VASGGMKLRPGSPDQRRLMMLLAVLAVVAVVAVFQLVGEGRLAGGDERIEALDYEPHNLPRLAEIDAVRGVPDEQGTGRNPFVFGVRPTATPQPTTPLPTRPPLERPTPRPTPTPRMIRVGDRVLPPPPPFDRQFIGFFGPAHLKVAAFRRPLGDQDAEIEVEIEGGVLDDTFIVREIGLESVTIGFVGYPKSEDTRVPLVEN